MTQTPEPETTAADDVNVAANVASDAVVDQVKERGFITTGEIFAAFPDLEPDTDELRDLWNMFESRGIKVLDEIAEELQREDQRRAGQAGDAIDPGVRRRVEHRPTPAPRPGSAARGRLSYTSEPDDELAAVRSAARATHVEGG